MNHNIEKLDAELFRIMRVMWMFLIIMSVYILYVVHSMSIDPDRALGMYHMIPEMIEHLLAGCVVIISLGVAFEYLAKRS